MMTTNFSRRGFVRLISFFSAITLALSAAALWNGHQVRAYRQQMTVSAQRALNELCENLDNITVSLQKGLYTNSDGMLMQVESALSKSAACAKVSLSQLTSDPGTADEIYKFLSQVGDFTLALDKRLQSGKQISDKQRSALQSLYTYAQSLSDGVRGMQNDYNDGVLSFENTVSTLSLDSGNAPVSWDDSLNDTAQSLADYPTLLYDGPFSDTVLNRDALAVKEMDEIPKQTALSRAAKWLDCKETELLSDNDNDGTLQLFCFSRAGKTIGVTKLGGLLAYVTNPSFSGEAQISTETAIKIAKKYLAAVGYTDMEESYYSTYDGVCTIVFHFVKDDVTYYADLIKVSVALDTADVVGMDARGYLMNHTARRLPEIKVSTAAAAKRLSPTLTLLHTKTALIPLEDGTEVLCHELHCRDAQGQEVLVYTDVTTGKEADLQILLYADDGVLAR